LWHDKGGNAVAQPLAGLVDPVTGLTFPDLNNPATELTQRPTRSCLSRAISSARICLGAR